MSYPSVKIPETVSGFSYDEQLFITRNSSHYSIQIEHSEDGSDHKSNMIEFIGRNLSQLISLDEMQTFLKRICMKSSMKKTISNGIIVEIKNR